MFEDSLFHDHDKDC